MTWYWYAAKANELFLDLDSPQQARRALRVLRLAQRPNNRLFAYRILRPTAVYLFPSMTVNHYHLIVVNRLDFEMDTRVSWSLWMGGDPLRAAYSLQRDHWGLPVTDLIVSQTNRDDVFRKPDSYCYCKAKHKGEKITKRCPALRQLLGKHAAADYFPRVRDERKALGPLILPYGKLSLSAIQRWENPKWTKTKLTSI